MGLFFVHKGTPTKRRPATLAIDVGGTGLKASVLDAVGKLMTDRVRVRTTYPAHPNDSSARSRRS